MNWEDKGWEEAALDYHSRRGNRTTIVIEPERLRHLRRLLGDEASLERAWPELSNTGGRAAQATVEALMFSLRSGVQALGHFDTIRRLSELSDQQLRDVAVRLQRFKPHIAPAWSAEQIAVLIAVRSKALAENS